MSLRDSILAANDRKTAPVPTPEWGVDGVYVRSLTRPEFWALKRRLKALVESNPEEVDIVDGVIMAAIISDAAGNPIFTEADAAALAGKHPAVIDRIDAAHRKLNAVDPAEVKEMEKNS